MKKITIVYWSGTGNTEAMANAIADGAREGGNEVKLLSVDKASLSDIEEAEAVALGCPSMGAEVLEESEMEPFVDSIQGVISGKKLALFGSYDWGNGEWMQDWEQRMEGYGASLVDLGLIINLEPDNDGIDKCRELGAKLSS